MFSHADWLTLKVYKPDGEGFVLSLYLDVDRAKEVNRNRGFERALHNMIRSHESQSISPSLRADWLNCRKAVEEFVHSYQPSKRSLLIFSNPRRPFWWHCELTVPLENELSFSDSPYLRPLAEKMDEYERYGVVLLDSERARFFSVYMGEIEELQEITTDVPRKTQTSGTDQIWSQKHQQRHHREHVVQHFRDVIEKLRDFTEENRFEALALGGSQQATADLVQALPKALSRRVAGTFTLPVSAKPQEALSHTKEIETRQRQVRQQELIDSLITMTNKGGKATLGLADTVEAINEGKVWRLVYDKSLLATGFVCRECGMLFAGENHGRCRRCGVETEPTPNLVNNAIAKVIEAGGSIDEVSDGAASRLAEIGHIGALLRY